ncbi:hypothetical protein [Nevskia ramosa]|uniref:hypothetical protein n=1 Tax=Nevskia ramosa TaxID=64002 RepID=UPI0023548C8A|nr:hypothetical protein [Nevskia ramosa]
MSVTSSSNAAANALANELAAQRQRARSASLRFNLLLGCATAVAMAVWLGVPVPTIADDPELARLLRGMAAIKAAIVVVTVAVLHWRFGRALSARLASLYLVGAWLISGASMMIWQLAQIPTAAFSFHLGAFVLLATAWRDRAS